MHKKMIPMPIESSSTLSSADLYKYKLMSAKPVGSPGDTNFSKTSSNGSSAPGFFSSLGAALSSGVSRLFYGEAKCKNHLFFWCLLLLLT